MSNIFIVSGVNADYLKPIFSAFKVKSVTFCGVKCALLTLANEAVTHIDNPEDWTLSEYKDKTVQKKVFTYWTFTMSKDIIVSTMMRYLEHVFVNWIGVEKGAEYFRDVRKEVKLRNVQRFNLSVSCEMFWVSLRNNFFGHLANLKRYGKLLTDSSKEEEEFLVENRENELTALKKNFNWSTLKYFLICSSSVFAEALGAFIGTYMYPKGGPWFLTILGGNIMNGSRHFLFLTEFSKTLSANIEPIYIENITKTHLIKQFFNEHFEFLQYKQRVVHSPILNVSELNYEQTQNYVKLLLSEKNDIKPLIPTKSYINFRSSSWEKQYRKVVNEVYHGYTKVESSPYTILFKDDGISQIYSTESFGFVTNVCYDANKRAVIFHDDAEEHVTKFLQSKRMDKYFYYNSVIVKKEPLVKDALFINDMGFMVTHPRQVRQVFHFLEANSLVLDIATRPFLYPPVDKYYIVDFRSNWDYRWSSKLKDLLIEAFPPRFRPQFFDKDSIKAAYPSNIFCAKGMSFISRWQKDNSGIYIGSYLASEVLRATLYRRIHISHADKFEDVTDSKRLDILIIVRRNKRILLNSNEIHSAINQTLNGKHNIRSMSLELFTPFEQMKVFSQSDIIIGPHGAGFSNIIFCEPYTAIIELMPFGWGERCYKEMTENVNCYYRRFTSEDNSPPPECISFGPESRECKWFGIRDKNFKMKPEPIVTAVEHLLPTVARLKYALLL
ncbi:hypothetical protein WA158_001578 [Blastocystis sp. Blastoise]